MMSSAVFFWIIIFSQLLVIVGLPKPDTLPQISLLSLFIFRGGGILMRKYSHFRVIITGDSSLFPSLPLVSLSPSLSLSLSSNLWITLSEIWHLGRFGGFFGRFINGFSRQNDPVSRAIHSSSPLLSREVPEREREWWTRVRHSSTDFCSYLWWKWIKI